MNTYLKLTNTELDLASSWEAWQQERFGDVLVPPGIDPEDPQPAERTADQIKQEWLIHTENLNNKI